VAAPVAESNSVAVGQDSKGEEAKTGIGTRLSTRATSSKPMNKIRLIDIRGLLSSKNDCPANGMGPPPMQKPTAQERPAQSPPRYSAIYTGDLILADQNDKQVKTRIRKS
jgi:hypothetical protein